LEISASALQFNTQITDMFPIHPGLEICPHNLFGSMILPLFSLFNIKSLRYPSVHYALLQERALGSMQVYHFITLPFQRSILQSLFFLISFVT
jgi:hypothetical protein